jgi:hypothetical protein
MFRAELSQLAGVLPEGYKISAYLMLFMTLGNIVAVCIVLFQFIQ